MTDLDPARYQDTHAALVTHEMEAWCWLFTLANVASYVWPPVVEDGDC
jgi:hypothetical protein